MRTVILNLKSSFELLFNSIPNYNTLKVFGCVCYAYNMDITRDRLSPRARKCVFISYPFGQKGYKVYDLITHKCFITRDVIFREEIFPYQSSHQSSSSNLTSSNDVPIVSLTNDETTLDIHTISSTLIHSSSQNSHVTLNIILQILLATFLHLILLLLANLMNRTMVFILITITQIYTSLDSSSAAHERTIPISKHNVTNHNNPPCRKSTRISKQPSKYNGFICPMLSSTASYSQSFSVQTQTPTTEPHSYAQDSIYHEWREAMHKEIHALKIKDTWDITSLPQGKKAIGF